MRKFMIATLVGVLSLSTVACKSRDNTAELVFLDKEVGITVDCDTLELQAQEHNELYQYTKDRWVPQAEWNRLIVERAEAEGNKAFAPLAVGFFNGMVTEACQS